MGPGRSHRSQYLDHAASNAEWAGMADCICEVLDLVYVRERKSFVRHARERGIGLEQLAAAALTEMIREKLSEKLFDTPT